ncbi:MAG: S8 family serine peptidase [Chloroflexi bacterium]|nr:S8 family serine peptidase [Chloroflexota bacterium]
MKRDRLAFLILSAAVRMIAGLLMVFAPAYAQLNTIGVAQPPDSPTITPITEETDGKLDPALSEVLTAVPPPPTARYIIYLHATADLNALETLPSTDDRHNALVQTLQQTAVAAQAPLRAKLAAMQTDGRVTNFQPLWIINAIAVTGQPESVYEIAQDPAVKEILLDNGRPLTPPPTNDAEALLTRALPAAAPTGAISPWGINKIQAPYVWHALGVSGQGVTVAIMDTGVDWQHPDLLPNYRGNLGGGAFNHEGNWFNTVHPTDTVPIDWYGHGTHVAGTAVGQNGLGVAPGAAWIAVNILSDDGFIYDSAVHLGFQWLLAPAGDPSLAPDIINGSWGGSGWLTTFLPDITAVQAAGIITIFAAGNNGPEPATILSPASLPGVLAVGASDPHGPPSWFSSRGPSLLTSETKPTLIAPGARILSAMPGGSYAYLNGTSMATPHTTGAAALLLSANPSLTRAQLTRILTETAVSVSPDAPNPLSGWGLLNAYAAVSTQAAHGTVTGQLRDHGAPLAGAVVTITTPTAVPLTYTTGLDGRFTAALRAGSYRLDIAPFGFYPTGNGYLVMQNGVTITQDFDLVRPSSGRLALSTIDGAAQTPLTATVTISGTPILLTTDLQGETAVTLPIGRYTLRISRAGYEPAHNEVTISANATTNLAVYLQPGPNIMLVDSGHWYYRSQAGFYKASLDNLGYAYDYWPIYSPFTPGIPSAQDLANYDIVIWSAPDDSPGYIVAGETITNFLGTGGSMLISGQNVGYYDGVGMFTEIWWADLLQARYRGKTPSTQIITGAAGTVYEGLSLTLNGGSSANNQGDVDQVTPAPNALADEIFYGPNGLAEGLQADQCRDYHLTYLGFGLEGVTQQADRDALLAQTFAFFQTPPTTYGLNWDHAAIDDFSPADSDLMYPLTLRNLSESLTDTISLRLDNAPWPVELSDSSLTIGPCETAVVTLTMRIPADAPKDGVYEWGITAVSHNSATTSATLPIRFKVPGDILLVDDDRWFNQEALYRTALTQAGFNFDEWTVGWDGEVRGSPPQALLDAYDYVIWYTGYDWYEPVSDREIARLTAYLAQGGRLFLSSQDFLDAHRATPLARQYLGIANYHSSMKPTQAYRADTILPPAAAGPLPLSFYTYNNNGDGLVPNASAEPFLWQEQGMAAGVAAQGLDTLMGDGERPYRAIFWCIPFEQTPVTLQPAIMNSIMGWLSDLGDSTFTVDKPVNLPDETRTYTITLRNFAPNQPNQVTITNTLPADLRLLEDTITGDARFVPETNALLWRGELAGGAVYTITYQAQVAGGLKPGTRINNFLEVTHTRPEANEVMSFNRIASVQSDTSDLSPSHLDVQMATIGHRQYVTYTLTLANVGSIAASGTTAVLRYPTSLTTITYTLSISSGTVTMSRGALTWDGSIPPNQEMTITLQTRRFTQLTGGNWLTAVAYIHQAQSGDDTAVRAQISYLPPYQTFLPIIAIRP